MKRLISMACGAAAIALMAGCATGYGGTTVAVGYDGYYDDYYGPFVDGYWGNDGGFYYMDNGGHRHRDTGGHFRHDSAPGFHTVHGAGGDHH
jgi:hypothetical protein